MPTRTSRFLLNADVGEGISTDPQLIPWLDLANISCGLHAGDVSSISQAVELCTKNQTLIAAHPSLNDREGWGRRMLPLSPEDLAPLLDPQIEFLMRYTAQYDQKITFIKPHGALYHLLSHSLELTHVFAEWLQKSSLALTPILLAGSPGFQFLQKNGFSPLPEFFADRAYLPNGHLVPRSNPHAILTDPEISQTQIRSLIQSLPTTPATFSGSHTTSQATFCLHGDHPAATSLAPILRTLLDDFS